MTFKKTGESEIIGKPVEIKKDKGDKKSDKADKGKAKR